MIDICEIMTHWHAGRSKNEIAASLGLSRKTGRQLRRCGRAGWRRRRGGQRGAMGGAGAGVGPGAGRDPVAAGDIAGDCGAREYIVGQLEAKVTVATTISVCG